jgi:hypothetical protein
MAKRAANYFSTTTHERHTVKPYSKGLKNCIDMVFHEGGVPPKSAKLAMMLDLGGKALCIEWKASDHLNSNKQVTC